jgi:chromosome partitioning protein
VNVLAIFSIKGGVGKTAAAVNLADVAARSGLRVLLWDLDPQGAASFYLRVKPRVKGGVEKLLRSRRALARGLRESDQENLDLMPADFSYRHMDLALDAAGKPRRRLARLLAPVANLYDVVLLDCPPSISLASEAVFRAADALVSPVVPTPLSLRTHEQLAAHLEDLGRKAPRLLPFLSMVDLRKALHRDIGSSLAAERPEFLKARIPYASTVEQMGVRRAALGAFAPRSRAALAFRELWGEIEGSLGAPAGPP